MLLLSIPVGLVGATLLAGAVAKRRPHGRRRVLTFFLTLAALLAVLRVGFFCYVLYRGWGGTASYDLIFPALLLLPEALLMPNEAVASVAAALAFSAALCAGSLAWSALLTLLARSVGDIK